MKPLEQLIAEQVRTSTVATLARATDTIAEELAHEILRDPSFRAEMRTIVGYYFRETIATLTARAMTPKARRARPGRRRRAKNGGRV